MDRDVALQQSVLETLQKFSGTEPMRKPFWSTLNYNRIGGALPMGGWGRAASDVLHEPPLLLAGAAEDGGFHVIYSRPTTGRQVGVEEQEDDGEPFPEKMARLTRQLTSSSRSRRG